MTTVPATVIDWADFKTRVSERGMRPQWYLAKKGSPYNDEYKIYALDGYLLFSWVIEKDGGPDQIDFETNYKDDWNKQLNFKDSSGLDRLHASPRPCNHVTYFSGAGDDQAVGDGNQLIFNLLSSDTSKSVDLSYSENVCLKDGVIRFENAPLGAYLDLEVILPGDPDTVVGAYAKKLFMLGTGRLDVNSEDFADVSSNLKIRVTVYNSDGTGQKDPAADFKVTGFLEMYRMNTV